MTTTHFGARRSLPRGSLPRRCRGPFLGGVRLRWRVWWRERDLDEQLASGTDPIGSDELSLRTGQLTAPESCERLACALEMIVAVADEDVDPTTHLLIGRAKVRACRALLLDLAGAVRDARVSDVQGTAMTARLIGNRTGPLYRGGSTEPLASAIFSTLFALQRRFEPNHERE